MTERDVMEYDVVVVGAGPAGLAFAIRLRQLEADTSICVLEKASEPGAHSLSGAVMEPQTLDALWPQWRDDPPSICVPATDDELALLTRRRRIRLPTPPQQKNDGNLMVSLGSLVSKMASHAESLGIDVFPGFAAAEALIEDGRVCGVRCGDMGVSRDGTPSDRFAPGVDIRAALTVLAEGCRGSVSKQLIERFELAQPDSPQTYGLGLKELWQLPPRAGFRTGLVQPHHRLATRRRTPTAAASPTTSTSDRVGGRLRRRAGLPRPALQPVRGLPAVEAPFRPYRPLLEGGEIHRRRRPHRHRGRLPGHGRRLEMPGAMLVGDARPARST
jgi:electron-transferring-flavoprotein dehydrogenase